MYSFVPPVVGVFDTPTTSLAINVEWRGFVVGILEKLLTDSAFGIGQDVYISHTPAVWFGDDDDQFLADNEIQKIISALGNGQNLVAIPSGTMNPYIGISAPDGWLLCNGAQYNQIDYPDLAAVLPSSLKSGSVFNVPDMTGKMPIGASSEVPVFVIAETGGESEHQLTISELPSHTHIQDSHNHTQLSHDHTQDGHAHTQPAHSHPINVRANATGFGTGAIALSNGVATTNTPSNNAQPGVDSTTANNQAATAVNQAATAVNQSTGGNLAHNNLPPYFVVNYIIKV